MNNFFKFLLLFGTLSFGVGLSKINAQNLIPNYSFENLNSPIDTATGNCILATGGVFLGYVPPWDSPSMGSPDPFNVCNGASGFLSIPSNPWWGYQYAHTGNGMVGAGFYSSQDEFREYLQVEMDTSLIADKKYCFSFYVNLANNSNCGCNNIGIYFSSNHTYDTTNTTHLSITPQFESTAIITDTANWTFISGSYIASGGEQYIIIGNFQPNMSTSITPVAPFGSGYISYYYIDDVDVHYCDPSSVDEINKNEEITISPNPITALFRITTHHENINQIKILNLLGETIFQSEITNSTFGRTSPKSEIGVDVSTLAKGLYFVTITTDAGVVNKKIVKE